MFYKGQHLLSHFKLLAFLLVYVLEVLKEM